MAGLQIIAVYVKYWLWKKEEAFSATRRNSSEMAAYDILKGCGHYLEPTHWNMNEHTRIFGYYKKFAWCSALDEKHNDP